MDEVGKNTLEEMRNAAWYNKWIYDYFSKCLRGEILEIGCGIGNFVPFLIKSGKLTSIDVKNSYIENLKKEYVGVKFGLGDIENNTYFFKNKKFDSIISLNVFEHIKDDEKALKNTYDLLKHGGNFAILVPAHKLLFSHFDKELGHFRRYSVLDLARKLRKEGFEIKQIRYFNWWAAIGWFVFVKLLRVKAMPSAPVGIFDTFGQFFLSVEKYIKLPIGISVVAICKK